MAKEEKKKKKNTEVVQVDTTDKAELIVPSANEKLIAKTKEKMKLIKEIERLQRQINTKRSQALKAVKSLTELEQKMNILAEQL